MQDTLEGLEFDSVSDSPMVKSTKATISKFLEGKDPHEFDDTYATALIQLARSIDSYVQRGRNPSTQFDMYDRYMKLLRELHPDPLADVDEEVADFIREAQR